MNTHYDVIIVGGGMVGATLAVALSEQPDLKIALIEAYQPTTLTESDPADLRVSALTQASEILLENLNIWQHLIHLLIVNFLIRVCLLSFSRFHV